MSETTLSSPLARTTPTGRLHRPGLVLATLLTCQLMIVLDVTVMNVALPRIQADLHFTPTSLSWVMTAYTLVYGGLLLLGGRAGDVLGRRRMLIAGVALFTAASLAGGFAQSAGWLIAARAVQALGSVMAGPSTLALLTTTVTDQKARVRALAWFSGMSSAGFAIGLIAGGLLTQWFGWRSVLFINVPFGVTVIALASRYLSEPTRHRARLDLPGAVTATAGTAALVYGFTNAAAHGWSTTATVISLVAGALLLATFLLIETRTAQPLLPLRLFADRDRAAAYAGMFLGPMVGMSMFFFLTQYLQEVHRLTALRTGFAFLPLAVMVFVFSRLTPRLLARFGPKTMAPTGTAALVAAVAVLTQVTTDTGYFPLLLVAMLLMGAGMGMAFSPLNVVIMGNVAPQDAGAAGGALQTVQQTGGSLGLAILVTIFGTVTRHATGSPAHIMVTGMTDAFIASAIIASLAFTVALTFRRAR
jgi:EmrB/QacA subfamily drug resistance transporter